MLWGLGLIIFLGLILIGIPVMLRNTANGKFTLSESITLYMIFPLPIFFLSYLLFCYESEDPTIAYNCISAYFTIAGLFMLTPIVISRYFNTPSNQNQNSEFIIYFIILILSGLIGLILYFVHNQILREFLNTNFGILAVIFIPFISIFICDYYRNRR